VTPVFCALYRSENSLCLRYIVRRLERAPAIYGAAPRATRETRGLHTTNFALIRARLIYTDTRAISNFLRGVEETGQGFVNTFVRCVLFLEVRVYSFVLVFMSCGAHNNVIRTIEKKRLSFYKKNVIRIASF
jgi:hypothetical protein